MKEPLREIDGAIRRGEDRTAREKLLALGARGVAREDAADVAFLAYRANLESLGIRLLNPLVRPKPRAPRDATDREKLYYALCLTRLGANAEALALFRSLDRRSLPDALLYQTFALVNRWDYQAAIPLLEEYVGITTDPYQRLVAKVNLVAARIYERQYDAADTLLGDLLRETEGQEALRLIRAKALQLGAVARIYRLQLAEATPFLDESAALLGGSQALDELFVRKWRAIRQLLEEGSDRALAPLLEIRDEAVRRAHWESVRDCDRFRALATRDERRLLFVWFGTPFPRYRHWLVVDFGGELRVPETFSWRLAEGSGPAVDVAAGTAGGAKASLRSWPVPHRLLGELCSDFYRPFRIGSLHAALFPDEHFNPMSSSARVRGSIRRLRTWLSDAQLPLSVEEDGGSYRLAASAPCELLVARAFEADRGEDPVDDLRSLFPTGPFSAREASVRLGLPVRTTIRLLTGAVEASALRRRGNGPATRYYFA